MVVYVDSSVVETREQPWFCGMEVCPFDTV